MAYNNVPRLDPDNVPPDPTTGQPRVYAPGQLGRPPYDWDQIIPRICDAYASGIPIRRACSEVGVGATGELYKRLAASPEYAAARRANALARVDASHERLLTLAEDSTAPDSKVRREAIDAARWEAEHSKWAAERADPESWGREDRVKIASVSAIRVVIEEPPQSAILPKVAVNLDALPSADVKRIGAG